MMQIQMSLAATDLLERVRGLSGLAADAQEEGWARVKVEAFHLERVRCTTCKRSAHAEE